MEVEARSKGGFDAIKDIYGHGIGIIAVIALLGLLFWYVDIHEVREWVERAGPWGPLVFILAKISTIVIAPISGSAIYPMAGAVFGFKMGFVYIFIGDFLGSTIAFLLSRILGRKVVEVFVGKGDWRYVTAILEYLTSWRGLIQARIFFIALPEAVAYAAGLSKLPYLKFIFVQMTLAIPSIALLVKFGSLLEEGTNSLVTSLVLILGTVVVLLGGSLFAWQIRQQVAKNV